MFYLSEVLHPNELVPSLQSLKEMVAKIMNASTTPESTSYNKDNINISFQGQAPNHWWITLRTDRHLASAMLRYKDCKYIALRATKAGHLNPEVQCISPSERLLTPKKSVAPAKKKTSAKKSSSPKCKATGGGGNIEQRFLGSMIKLKAAGLTKPSRQHVALLAGYPTDKSPGFLKTIGIMNKRGYVTYLDKVTVALTAEGLAAAGDVASAATTTAEVHQHVHRLLQPIQIRLFEVLDDGQVRTRTDVATAMGYEHAKASGFMKIVGQLKSLGIIEYVGESKQSLRLADIAFPFGRPEQQNIIAPNKTASRQES